MPRPSTAPHPGWECCDPTKDLAGWIVAVRQRCDEDGKRVPELHAEGKRLMADAIQATIAGDSDKGLRLRDAAREAHGQANAIAQRVLVRRGHVDRVEAAHQYRLATTQPDLFIVAVPSA